MGRGNQRGQRDDAGGIISLAQFCTEHREAVTYDLLTHTGYGLDSVGRELSWPALGAFIKNTMPDSALFRELRPDLAQWSTVAKTNALLADLYDMLNVINSNLCAKGTRRKPKRPKPYQRPADRKSRKEKHIGTPLPIEELKRRIFGTKQGGET